MDRKKNSRRHETLEKRNHGRMRQLIKYRTCGRGSRQRSEVSGLDDSAFEER